MSVLFAIFCIFAALTCGIAIGYYMGNKDGYEIGKTVGYTDGVSDALEAEAIQDRIRADYKRYIDDVKAEAE